MFRETSWAATLGMVVWVLWIAQAASVWAVDCNGNGVRDDLDLNRGESEDCNQNGVPDECESAPLEFGLRERGRAVGKTPLAVVAADLDGDGLTDLAVGHGDLNQSTVSIVRSSSGGNFEEAVHYPAGTVLNGLAAGDLDGDQDTDLVTANVSALFVLRNGGDGTFLQAERIAVPSGTRTVTVADLDGDGIGDLVFPSSGPDQVSVLLNDGGVAFREALPFDVGDGPASVVVADLNGDGLPDIAAANKTSGTVSVLLNQGGVSVAMAPAVDCEVSVRQPDHLVAADLDGDGDIDLAVAGSNGVATLENLDEGSFAASPPFVGAPDSLTVGDLDGDLDLDLAFGDPTAAGKVVAVINDGAGNFRASRSFTVESAARAVTAADLDEDGDLDLAFTTTSPDSLGILWNGEADTLAVETTFVTMGRPPHGATMGDFDGDGDLDFATANGGHRDVSIILNEDGVLRVRGRLSTGGYLNAIANGDFDGDGDFDLVVPDRNGNRVQILENNGGAVFSAPRNYPTGTQPFYAAVGDLDEDGDADVVTADRGSSTLTPLLNNGSGVLQRGRAVRTGTDPLNVLVHDLDGDGDLDLAAASQAAGQVSVHLGGGDGTFGDRVAYGVGGRPLFVVAGDFDGDGGADLAAVYGRHVSLFSNRGDGSFDVPTQLLIEHSPYSAIATDVNGDSHLDIVTANQGPNTVSVLTNDGGGAFRSPLHYTVGIDPRYVFGGDIDGDGDTDIVSANHTSENLTVLHNRSRAPAPEHYLELICTELDYHEMSRPKRGVGSADRSLRYMTPASDDPDLLPVLFQNTERHPLHQEFLESVFPERFAGLKPAQYDGLVGRRATREYYVGALLRFRDEAGIRYGFSVYANTSASAEEILREEEVRWVYERLRGSFLLDPLGYFPDSPEARTAASGWEDPGFPVFLEDITPDVPYVAYTRAVGYGTVKILDEEAFEEANESGRFSFQDIVILERAPRDIEGVVGGVLTAEAQGELSHLQVRTARRGTPNAYLAGAMETFAPLEGKLIRLEVRETDYTVDEVTLEQAQAFWDASRPQLGETPTLDPRYAALDSFEEMDLSGAEVAPEARYGGKATNLARLQRVLDGLFEEYREPGLAVPVSFYLEFVRSNQIASEIEPGRQVTYEEFLEELFSRPEFRSDSEFRFQALARLREHMENQSSVEPDLITRVAVKIQEVFGSTRTRVRFRSSSNVEDVLEFNGAGLYRSTSACAADDLDIDAAGPSRCGGSDDERGIGQALRRVWASLWNYRAYEEREFFGIPQDSVAMAVLVTRAFVDEVSNGVAFTGNPGNPDDPRYIVTAQLGDVPVVSPDPGIIPERNVLEVVDGAIQSLRRRASSLVPEGLWVLSETQLDELARFLWHVDQEFPVELGGHSRDEVILDLEFKFERDGSLAVKQVRPFLNVSPPLPTPTFELEIPAGTVACGVFVEGRTPREEYELKSRLEFRPGLHVLPTASESFSAELLEEVVVGPTRELAVPEGPGLVRFTKSAPERGVTTYTFSYRQEFTLPSGALLTLDLRLLGFQARDVEPLGRRVIDDAFLTNTTRTPDDPLHEEQEPEMATLRGSLSNRDFDITYSSCTYEALPLWHVAAELDDGTTLNLEERFQSTENPVATGPAGLARAEVVIAGECRATSDYWDLVYAAGNHNTKVRYWVVLDDPVAVDGLGRPVHAVELVAPDDFFPDLVPEGNYLDENFELLGRRAVARFEKERAPDDLFRRGDVNADGEVNLTDAVSLLLHLFQGGVEPPCGKAADADDTGELNLTDGVTILLHLFAGRGSLPEPFRDCGSDPTDDKLECAGFAPCP